MGVNKLVINDEVKLDMTGDTVTPDCLLEGVTAHDCTGAPISGTLPHVEQAKPDMSASLRVVGNLNVYEVRALAWQPHGVVPEGSKESAYRIGAVAGRTVYPSTKQKLVVASGYYTAGDISVAGDENLVSENIRSGVSLFGVPGNLSAGGYLQYHLRGDEYTLNGNSLPADLSNGILLLNPVLGDYEIYNASMKTILCAFHDGREWKVALYQNGYVFSESLELQNDESRVYLDSTEYNFVPGAPYLLLLP